MLYSNKRLQNTDRYEEYQSLQDSYYKLSLSKEQAQQNFYKRMRVSNQITGEVIKLHHSFEKYYKQYTKSIEQKVYAIELLAKEKDLVPVFITLTLPSSFHPFSSISYKDKRLYTALNKEFEFDSIESSIANGYQHLNQIYRTFYKRVKNSVKDLLYVKVIEAHKTMIPHLHVLFYIPKSKIRIFRKTFTKIQSEFELDQTDFELVDNELQEKENKDIKTGINRASKYLMKYITKSLNDGADIYQARILDGWKRDHKIRMITMSNLQLSMAEFRTIYHNLDEDSKDNLLNEAKEKNINLFYLILKNIYKLKVVNKDNTKQVKQHGSINAAKIMLFSNVTRYKQRGGYYCYQVNSFTFFIDHKLIYEKEKYERIISRRNYYEY